MPLSSGCYIPMPIFISHLVPASERKLLPLWMLKRSTRSFSCSQARLQVKGNATPEPSNKNEQKENLSTSCLLKVFLTFCPTNLALQNDFPGDLWDFLPKRNPFGHCKVQRPIHWGVSPKPQWISRFIGSRSETSNKRPWMIERYWFYTNSWDFGQFVDRLMHDSTWLLSDSSVGRVICQT